jgi:uracil-DNA glycosylase
MTPQIPAGWRFVLAGETAKPYYRALLAFVAAERRRRIIFPPPRQVFAALELTPFDRTNVVLLGQDPYVGPREAHGLCFSVRPRVPLPPSLVNIFRELADDLGCRIPNHGNLTAWARQGVLMLNTVLTVRAGDPGSHRGHGWEIFTNAVIEAVSAKRSRVVFVLWGQDAQRTLRLIDRGRHVIITGAHPSPLSARRGFFGSRPFSRINTALRAAGKRQIRWQIPDI